MKFNYNWIKEINTRKSKEEILEDESKIKNYLQTKKEIYLNSRKEFFTEKNFSFHKYNILRMILRVLYYLLFIIIAILQLKIFTAYDSQSIKKFLLDQRITLDNSYYDFGEIPTERILSNLDNSYLKDKESSILERINKENINYIYENEFTTNKNNVNLKIKKNKI